MRLLQRIDDRRKGGNRREITRELSFMSIFLKIYGYDLERNME